MEYLNEVIMKNLNEMTSKELKEVAKEMGVKNWWNLKKSDLIAEIEKLQNSSEEEKAEAVENEEKEKAAVNEYTKNWKKYTKRYNVGEFLEGWRSGKIVLESEEDQTEEQHAEEVEETPEEKVEVQPEEKVEENKSEKIAKENIKNAYDWTVGGYENSVSDGELTQEEFDEWIQNTGVNEVYSEAINSTFGEGYSKSGAPSAMKSVSKKFCLEYIVELFKNDGYEVEMPEIKAGHAPTAKRGQLIEFDGKAMNICAWGKELGISPNTLYGRIYKMGWSVEKAFTTPSKKNK